MLDITKTDGIWLTNEDKQFYEIQIKSQGEVGYVTAEQVRVHSSKVVTQNAPSSSSLSKNVASTIASNILRSSETSDNATSDCDKTVDSIEPASKVRKTKQYSNTKIALQLVKKTNLSYSKLATVCKQLSYHGIDIPTPRDVNTMTSLGVEMTFEWNN